MLEGLFGPGDEAADHTGCSTVPIDYSGYATKAKVWFIACLSSSVHSNPSLSLSCRADDERAHSSKRQHWHGWA